MKTYPLLATFLAFVGMLLSSCENFEELEKDPNRSEKSTPALVFTGILNDMPEGAWNDVMRWNQFYASNYNYYSNNEYNWTATTLNYSTLKNVLKMEEEAFRDGGQAVNPYSALGKFFKAYYFVRMTQRVGDLPMKEALKGLKDGVPDLASTKAKYDTQKEVYLQALTWLDEANSELTQLLNSPLGASINGDIYLGNDLRKWQKVVNTFKLRVLISLSKKESDSDLKIKARFAEVMADPAKFPIMVGMEDNLQYTYNDQLNKYPRNRDNFGNNATRENMTATYLNKLVELKDPRTFVVAEPATKKVQAGLSPTDFAAFVGAPSDEDLANMSTKAGNGEYSFQNRKRYYSGYTAEPNILIGYAEQSFAIAEAIHRGWVAGNAEEYYKKGVLASINFYGILSGTLTVYFQKVGGKLGDYTIHQVNVDLEQYYAQPAVKYAGNNADGLSQILTQKYLAFFQNSGWEAFYNQRRTGIPTFFATNSGNGNSGRIPRRWQYPASEANYNTSNYQQAIQQQFAGKDDINTDLWLLK